MKIDVDGERVDWLNMKWIQVCKDKEYSIFVNYVVFFTLVLSRKLG
jgi:hypothetical protein